MQTLHSGIQLTFQSFLWLKDCATNIHHLSSFIKNSHIYKIALEALNRIYNLFCYFKDPASKLQDRKVCLNSIHAADPRRIEVSKIRKIANMFFFMQIVQLLAYIPYVLSVPLSLLNLSGLLGLSVNTCGFIGAGLMIKAEICSYDELIKSTNKPQKLQLTERALFIISYETSAYSLAIHIFSYFYQLATTSIALSAAYQLGVISLGSMMLGYVIWAYNRKDVIIEKIQEVAMNTTVVCSRFFHATTRQLSLT